MNSASHIHLPPPLAVDAFVADAVVMVAIISTAASAEVTAVHRKWDRKS